ncbi:MAG: RNA polymerase sigma factor [bacterium]
MNVNIKNKFEAVYEVESDAIFRFCLTRVSNREQAMDITQETFLRLWQSMQDDKEILNNRAFIFTIARHLIIDWYRKKKSISLDSLAHGNKEEEEYDVADNKTTEVDLFLGVEGRHLVNKINELSPSYRDPVYLRFVEDLSPGEIGEILGTSANTASVRINRGIIELRKIAGYNNDINKK